MQGQSATARFVADAIVVVVDVIVATDWLFTYHVNGILQGDLNAADHVNSLAGIHSRTTLILIRVFARHSRVALSSRASSCGGIDFSLQPTAALRDFDVSPHDPRYRTIEGAPGGDTRITSSRVRLCEKYIRRRKQTQQTHAEFRDGIDGTYVHTYIRLNALIIYIYLLCFFVNKSQNYIKNGLTKHILSKFFRMKYLILKNKN